MFCLDRVNLGEAKDKFPGEISGGMQKRVAIAPVSYTHLDVYKRQAFRCSLGNYYCEVERLIRCEGFTAYQVLINSECAVVRSQE